MTSSQEMEWVYSYNPRAHTGQVFVKPAILHHQLHHYSPSTDQCNHLHINNTVVQDICLNTKQNITNTIHYKTHLYKICLNTSTVEFRQNASEAAEMFLDTPSCKTHYLTSTESVIRHFTEFYKF